MLARRQDSKNTLNKKIVDLGSDETYYYPLEQGFKFGIALTDTSWSSKQLNESFIRLTFNKFSFGFDENGDVNVNSTSYDAIECTDQFPIDSRLSGQGRSLSKIYCPQGHNISLRGNFRNENFVYFQASISRCSQNCSDDASIDSYIDNTYIHIIHVSSYIDFDDYDNPIKEILSQNQIYRLSKAFRKGFEMELRK